MSKSRFLPSMRAKAPLRRRGSILVVVLVVTFLLILGAYTFAELMLTHREAAELANHQIQARMLVDSGVDSVKLFLMQPESLQTELGGRFNNPQRFQNRIVIDDPDPEARACFTVLAPNLDDEGQLAGVRYGLEDESSRLNLNVLVELDRQLPGTGRTLLMALPGMTEDVADAILDWLDADDEQRDVGAEADHYSGQNPPYMPHNGPIETVEELLLVRGVTPQLLFGMDANRNGSIDPHETLQTDQFTSELPPGLERGWSAYLTLHSAERNTNPDGKPRIFLNMPDIERLHDELAAVFPPDWVTFIIAYRQFGPFTGMTATNVQPASAVQLDLTKPAQSQLTQVLDLIGAKVAVNANNQQITIDSPFSADIGAMNVYLPQLMDQVTVNKAKTIPGRININQAPVFILRGIPNMTEDLVAQILSQREPGREAENRNRQYETWLLSAGIVTLEQMRMLQPFITGGGSVYRAQVVGYFQGGEASSRAEVIFDATGPLPRVLFWRDISHLGRGYALETLGVNLVEN